jgi:hypothetical protein
MVQRRLNVPVGKIGVVQPFWMSQVLSSEWVCRSCRCQQPKLSVAFEMWRKGGSKPSAVQGSGNVVQWGEKTYLCLACAETLFAETLDKIRVCKELGPEAFRLMEEV